MAAPPAFPPPGSLRARLLNRLVALNAIAYRRTGGRIGGRMSGGRVLLLHHVGRRTGQERTTPVMYAVDGEDLVVVASRGGSDAMPAWYLNLKARPEIVVQVGPTRRRVVARDATPAERDRLWRLAVENYEHFDTYQERTARAIPVVVLEPASA